MDSSLLPFFKPRGAVVIGASTSPEKLGYGVARNLIQSGYQGTIHFVGQKQGELFGRPIYTDLSQVPDPVDLAILIIPPNATPKTIEECGRRGIKAAIIMSSGFREVGEEGAALEKQCLDVARAQGVRLLGPNCIGTIDTHLPLDTTFLQPPMPVRGHIGFISHSGAFCAAIIDWARREGFGFSQIISLGNQADVNETDALAAIADDEHTRVIVLYMESVSDGRRFVQVAREVTGRKPVIALKVGRFESGQKAAASHTGALAASDIAFDAAFEKAGILRADSAEQMFDWARALESHPRGLGTLARNARYPSINSGQRSTSGDYGIAILTNAGGPGVIAADALETNGLSLAKLNEPTLKALIAKLPPAASVFNPVDMLASASPVQYSACLKILLEDSNVDGVMVILPPPPMFRAEDVAEKLVEVIGQFDKPVVIALMGSVLVQKAVEIFTDLDVPTYPFPERAASALGSLVKRAEYFNGAQRLTPALPGTARDLLHSLAPPARAGVRMRLAAQRQVQVSKSGRCAPGASVIPEEDPTLVNEKYAEVRRLRTPEELLAAYEIQTAPIKLAHSVDEAVSIADSLGYPVVMKIASPDISHKSDVSGVLLNITDAPSLHSGYTQIMKRVKELKPEARIEGVHIQRQIPQGQEVIVGMVRDPQFGALMMYGSGGVEVEGLKDVSFALAPLNQAEAEKMIRKTWAGRRLKGFRHIPPADEDSVIEVLIKLSQLAMENEFIEEIEINPLRVLDKGAIALDVRIKSVVQ